VCFLSLQLLVKSLTYPGADNGMARLGSPRWASASNTRVLSSTAEELVRLEPKSRIVSA
jgi:hypothetical protein